MITFKKLRFKNFKSYGNSWSEIDYSKNQLTAISGKNAQGKSAASVDALCFALYGKTISNTPRGKLVNSINGKGLVVECEFDTNGHSYKVVRGLKPSIFQIYQDNKLLNEESNVRDYQEVLENQILKVHIKNFMQTIVISTASYTPFMELNASDRRVIIENILGVGVLTDMNGLLKEKAQQNNEQLTSVHYDIENIKVQLESDKHVVNTLKQAKERDVEQINQQIVQLTEQLQTHTANIEKINANLAKITPVVNQYGSLKNAQRELLQKQGEVKSTLAKLLKDSKFVQSHDYCPICKQTIEQSHKDKIVQQTTEQSETVQQTLTDLQSQMDSLNEKEQKFLELVEKYNQLNQQLSEQNTAVYMLNNQIVGLNQQLIRPNNEAEIEQRTQSAWEKARKAKDLLCMKNELLEYKAILDQASLLLRDSGIKTAVINQYLPTINQMINKYLADMDFYLSFELDEKFNETIKARYRDEYTYQNLSQGERRRLDFAIMLTWRYIAEIRNSCSCNIMIIDELIDSALDGEGIDSIMKLLKKMTEGSIFVISHRESVQDIGFEHALHVEKEGQFSTIKEISVY